MFELKEINLGINVILQFYSNSWCIRVGWRPLILNFKIPHPWLNNRFLLVPLGLDEVVFDLVKFDCRHLLLRLLVIRVEPLIRFCDHALLYSLYFGLVIVLYLLQLLERQLFLLDHVSGLLLEPLEHLWVVLFGLLLVFLELNLHIRRILLIPIDSLICLDLHLFNSKYSNAYLIHELGDWVLGHIHHFLVFSVNHSPLIVAAVVRILKISTYI